MTRDEKEENLNELYDRLQKLESSSSKKRNNARYLIDRDRLKREIRDLKYTMTDEDFEKLMIEVKGIDVNKC